ncbi:hypothetical protein GIB67_040820 [Kingdonia uniflora]|uniref:DUF1279 domain-containing protein n=1 Tax=Kingdonia uniflora TaxID=39325 RepID=A0A7J7P4F5_9MAGN|nr:hypothetical protein GIB67_040820 [Kingdonia uniflora]
MFRFRELMKKYGKVAFGVHMSVSAASITGLYVAIKNNVDVESLFEKVGISSVVSKQDKQPVVPDVVVVDTVDISSVNQIETFDGFREDPISITVEKPKKNRTGEMAASGGSALALAILCNKALFPVRVPITIALTPQIAKFLVRRKIIKNTV